MLDWLARELGLQRPPHDEACRAEGWFAGWIYRCARRKGHRGMHRAQRGMHLHDRVVLWWH